MQDRPVLIIGEGELSVTPEAVGKKVVRFLKDNRGARVEILVSDREPDMVKTGHQTSDDI